MSETNNNNLWIRGINFLKRKKKVLSSKLKMLKYKYLQIDYGLNRTKRPHQIIISLTSYPKRLNDIYLTIKSLMHQSVKADKIILYLGCDSKDYPLNRQLLALKDKGLEIVYVDEDIKSHKKYYYVMQQYPESLIITADDDLIYDEHFISGLYEGYLKNPNCIQAYRVHKYKFENQKILPYNLWDLEYGGVHLPSKELFVTTGAGVLFPPAILPKECFNKQNIIDLCLFADDIWINFFILKANLKVQLVSDKSIMPTVNFDVQMTNLNTNNVDQGGNDIFLKQLVAFYQVDLYKCIYEE